MLGTLTDMLAKVAGQRPESIAMVESECSVTFAELELRSQRVAQGLSLMGIGVGDRVAIWLPNMVQNLVLCFALWRLGAVVVGVNTRLRHAEVESLVRRSRAKMLALWPDFNDIDYLGMLAEMDASRLPDLRAVLICGDSCDEAEESLARWSTSHYAKLDMGPALELDNSAPDLPCAIFTTSGTTKQPKLVLHRHSSLVANARDGAAALRLDAPDSVVMQLAPLCGVFGMTQALTALAAGRPQVIQTLFDAADAGALALKHRATHMIGTDDMFSRLLATQVATRPFPSFRLCPSFGVNPPSAEYIDEATRRGLPLIGLYGMSEIMALFSLQRPDAPLDERLIGGGYPVSTAAQVRVRNMATGDLQPPGQSGEIEVRGPTLMIGYDGDPESTTAALTDDGYFRTGDLGYLRTDGSLVFQSRIGDVLRLAGFLVSPREIEAHLDRHPTVEASQVVEVRTERGSRAVAFVICRPGKPLDEPALRAHCRRELADYKVPIRFFALSRFPTTESANATRVQRTKLRQLATELLTDAMLKRDDRSSEQTQKQNY